MSDNFCSTPGLLQPAAGQLQQVFRRLPFRASPGIKTEHSFGKQMHKQKLWAEIVLALDLCCPHPQVEVQIMLNEANWKGALPVGQAPMSRWQRPGQESGT